MNIKDIIFNKLLFEAVSRVGDGKKGILVLDIDDTLLKADPTVIGVIKTKDGKTTRLTTEQFAKDPESKKPYPPGVSFSIEEFRDPKKVYASIVQGTPMLKNLKIMDAHIKAQYDVAFLTARGLQDVVTKALQDFLMFRDKDNKLQPIGDKLKTALSAAINDEVRFYPGETDAEKKGNVLKNLSKQYDRVVFVDDDEKNINMAKSLGLKNLVVIKAH